MKYTYYYNSILHTAILKGMENFYLILLLSWILNVFQEEMKLWILLPIIQGVIQAIYKYIYFFFKIYWNDNRKLLGNNS